MGSQFNVDSDCRGFSENNPLGRDHYSLSDILLPIYFFFSKEFKKKKKKRKKNP